MLIVFLFIILKIVSIKYKRHGYLLFNIYKPQYQEVKEKLTLLASEKNVNLSDVNYNIRKPWLIVFKNTDLKTTNSLIKDLEKAFSKKPKKITMYNYWFLIGFLTLLVILWRF